MFSTEPLASVRSAAPPPVSISWNFTEELPQFRTSTFTGFILRVSRERPLAGLVAGLLRVPGLVVGEEALAALHSQVAGADHLSQQRARPVLDVAELVEQVLHPAHDLVEPHAVGELQRADRQP